jgi:hypothetical protein
MNAQEILNELYSTPVEDPSVLAMAQQLEAMTKAFQTGQMSASEYQELLGDFRSQQLISTQCQDLESKEKLNNIINVVINVGSALSSI